jgi:hypothetical protein
MAARLRVDLDCWRRELDEVMLRVGGRLPSRAAATDGVVRMGPLVGLQRGELLVDRRACREEPPQGMVQQILRRVGQRRQSRLICSLDGEYIWHRRHMTVKAQPAVHEDQL